LKPYIKKKKWLVEFDMIWMRFVHSILETDWSIKAMFVLRKMVFWKSLFKLSCVCLLLEKLINKKHFPVKEKFGLVSWKVFSLDGKHFSRSCEKIRNVMLFADYIKFDPQTFDCYIFYLNLFFSISSLRICFNFTLY
jgi:hypothetical protein